MYGAPVTGPMEIPQQIASAFSRPEMAEMPEMKDATTGTIRLEGTLAKRLPNMPSGDLNDLGFSNSRQVEAQKLMNDMRIAYGESRQYSNRSKAIAKAKGRQAQRQVERSNSEAENRLSKGQGRSVRMQKSAILRNARDVLGMGTDLYK